MFPFGKTAHTTRMVSAGISGIGCGFRDIAGLLLCLFFLWKYNCLFILSIKWGHPGFRHQYHCEDEPIPDFNLGENLTRCLVDHSSFLMLGDGEDAPICFKDALV